MLAIQWPSNSVKVLLLNSRSDLSGAITPRNPILFQWSSYAIVFPLRIDTSKNDPGASSQRMRSAPESFSFLRSAS